MNEDGLLGLEAGEERLADGAEVVVHEASGLVALVLGESFVVFFLIRVLGVVEFIKDGGESSSGESHDTGAVIVELLTDDGEEGAGVLLLEAGAQVGRELSNALHGGVADEGVLVIEAGDDDLADDGIEVGHEGLHGAFEDVAEEGEGGTTVLPVGAVDVLHDAGSSELFHSLSTNDVGETISTLSTSIEVSLLFFVFFLFVGLFPVAIEFGVEHVLEEEVEELVDELTVALEDTGLATNREEATESHVTSIRVELLVAGSFEASIKKGAIAVLEGGDIRFFNDTTDSLGLFGGFLIITSIDGGTVGVDDVRAELTKNAHLVVFGDVDELTEAFDGLGAELGVVVGEAGSEGLSEAGKTRGKVGGDEHGSDLREDFQAHGTEGSRLVITTSSADEELPQVRPGIAVTSGELGGEVGNGGGTGLADGVGSIRGTEAVQERLLDVVQLLGSELFDNTEKVGEVLAEENEGELSALEVLGVAADFDESLEEPLGLFLLGLVVDFFGLTTFLVVVGVESNNHVLELSLLIGHGVW